MSSPAGSSVRRLSRLLFRPITRKDVPEALELLPPWLNLTPEVARAMPALWERLVEEPSVISGVIEDRALPPGQRVQAWGVTMVLPQQMAQELQLEHGPRAFVSREIYARLHEGRLHPMSDREIGMANAREGLSMHVLHFSHRNQDIADPYTQAVIATANNTFRTMHNGYNISGVYFEHAASGGSVVEASGFQHIGYSNESDLASLQPGVRPAFYGLTRVRAREQVPGSLARSVFEYQPPLFAFSASQRRLLWWTLFDESDDAIMPLLGTSVHGLKKLWRGIYERIEDRMPEFFGDAAGADDGKRGREKRHQVLAYLRQRPEELRPYFPQAGPARAS